MVTTHYILACIKMMLCMTADKHAGCMFTIASVGSVTSHDMIAVYIESHQNNSITLMTADKNSSSVGIITYRKQYREVNNSLDCHVDSLEVYRGKKKVIKIRHGGFSIDENESIEVIALFTTM